MESSFLLNFDSVWCLICRPFRRPELSTRQKNIIYQITNGCAHLTEKRIEEVIRDLIKDEDLQNLIVQRILTLKREFPDLGSAKRHPVILLLDEVRWRKLLVALWQQVVEVDFFLDFDFLAGFRRKPSY